MTKPVSIDYISDRVAIPMDVKPTYGSALDALRSKAIAEKNAVHPRYIKENGSEIYRPLTMQENAEMFLNDFETKFDSETGIERTLDERARLADIYLDSSTATTFKEKSTRFTLIPESKHLIELRKNFSKGFIKIDYNKIIGIPFDSTKGKYNTGLSLQESKDEPFWIEALTKPVNDRHSEAVFQIKYERLKKENLNIKKEDIKMKGIYINQNAPTDELRGVCIRSIGNGSNANAGYDLYGSSCFLLVTPKKNSSK